MNFVFRRVLTTSLRARVLLLTVALFVAVAIPAALVFDHVVSTIIVRLGTLIAEKQILYDRTRGLEALLREASLAETLTRSPAIREWAADEASPEKKARAIAELERYRLAFKDNSYFLVVDRSGNYYFNDREDSFAGAQLRYTVRRDNPRDGWYFKTAAQAPTCQLNVDRDDNLAVTKVWINCVVRADGKVLGIVGTGIDLADFIREVVAVPQRGVESIFVDSSGAIQAHRNPDMVDFHSLTKDTKAKKTIFLVVDSDKDRETLKRMMDVVASGETLIDTGFVHIGGHRVLAGVGYLGEIGWFNVTFMDLDEIVDRRLFVPLGVLFAVMLVVVAVLVSLLFERVVLKRLARLESWVRRVEAGDYGAREIDAGADEIGRLSHAFGRMAKAVGRQTDVLEAVVRERTRQLEAIANRDPLTGLLNRRGFLAAAASARAGGGRFGFVLVDIDMLKDVNDALGHAAGDAVLVACAERIGAAVGSDGACGRWGGDEFVVLSPAADEEALAALAGRLRAAIGGLTVSVGDGRTIAASVSIGAALAAPGEEIDAVAARADAALYAAKRAGRDRVALSPGGAGVG